MANKPNNPSLWSRAKSLARQKFDVYPSAYANGWAAKWYKSKGGTWSKAKDGMQVPDNPGFEALPPAVQRKIIDNMAFGGYIPQMGDGGKMPPEIARARFVAAGNADKLDDYGYAYGGYIPEMAYGGSAQQAAIAIAMKKAGKKPKNMKDGGEPNGEMALGQMAAVQDKMRKLLQFVKPDDNLDPWIASKLAVMDHSADAIADYMMYGPEAEEMGEMDEMKSGGGIPERYRNKGFTRVGAKRQSTRPGKKWMVLAKKGDQYKVVHGGYDGMKDYTQHGNEQRRKNFWNRMGGKNSAKATDPFSPLYWHKRFGTWQEGGLVEYAEGDPVPVYKPMPEITVTAPRRRPRLGMPDFGSSDMTINEQFNQDNFGRPMATVDRRAPVGMPALPTTLAVPQFGNKKSIKPPTDKDYDYITPALFNMGLNAVAGIAQGISDNRNINYNTSDSLMPVVRNNYSRGRNEINTGRYADDSLVPVQFAGTPVAEYYGAPMYQMAMGGSFDVASGIMGLPKMRDNVGDYREAQLNFDMPTNSAPEVAESSAVAAAPAAMPGRDAATFRNYIKMRESRGDYEAQSSKSSGTGAYQFIWSLHNDWIKSVTGVKSKQEFLKNPEAQEKAFDYWDANTLTPAAMRIKRQTGTRDSLEQIKMKVHFAGPGGAMKFYKTGEETVDAYGTKTSTYAQGGEYDLSAEQIQEILKNGGQIEYL